MRPSVAPYAATLPRHVPGVKGEPEEPLHGIHPGPSPYLTQVPHSFAGRGELKVLDSLRAQRRPVRHCGGLQTLHGVYRCFASFKGMGILLLAR